MEDQASGKTASAMPILPESSLSEFEHFGHD